MPPDEREGYLDALPGPVRAEVLDLLRAATSRTSPSSPSRRLSAAHLFASGVQHARVGPYQVGGLLAQRGALRVFSAHRADGAFEQTAALLTVPSIRIDPGGPAAYQLRRARNDLARLDHPGLARLLDGGETHDGVPYLITTLPAGTPVTRWAHERQDTLSILRVMRDAARALGHAHRSGVVHGSIHPDAVVVSGAFPEARPTVMGFGAAALLGAARTDAPGAPLPMPLAYAPPERLSGPASPTPEADVFGLGVLLYEALTGLLPYGDLGPGSPNAQRPLSPSDALRAKGSRVALAGSLRRDLDAVCLKALHPGPARRYPNADALADDLSRCLAYRPVAARARSWSYRARRYARRRRSALLVGTALLGALLLSIGFAFRSLDHERELLVRERAAQSEAEAAAQRASEATALLTRLFEAARPEDGRGLTFREALDETRQQVAQAESPELRAHLSHVLGWTYYHFGDLARADQLLADAARTYDTADVPADVRALAWADFARTRAELGDWERALASYLRAEAVPGLERDAPASYHVLTSLPWVYRSMGRHEEAIAASYRLIGYYEARPAAPFMGDAHYELGQSLVAAGQLTEGIAWLRNAHALHTDRSGPDSPAAIHAGFELGVRLIENGLFAESMPLVDAWIRFSAQDKGPEHPHTARGYKAKGDVLLARGAFSSALRWYERAAGVFDAALPDVHLNVAKAQLGRARALNGLGRYDAALDAADTAHAALPASALPAVSDQIDAERARARCGLGRTVAGCHAG
jgi:serine/threonine protein kinase